MNGQIASRHPLVIQNKEKSYKLFEYLHRKVSGFNFHWMVKASVTRADFDLSKPLKTDKLFKMATGLSILIPPKGKKATIFCQEI